MTDDIVTRLLDFTPWSDADLARTMLEAADEIERLREAVNLWMGAAERFAESHPQYEAFRYYFRARTK